MAITSGAWSSKSVNGKTVFTCRVSAEGGEADMMTLPTPALLDTRKPFSIIVDNNEDLSAAGATALDIWGCVAEGASLATGDAGTNCFLVHANSLDLDANVDLVVNVFPDGGVAQVTNASPGTAQIPSYPYLILNLDCTTTIQDATYVDFYIIQ